MKICPDCGKIIFFNSYFGAFLCHDCGWIEDKALRRSSLRDGELELATSQSNERNDQLVAV